MVSNVCSLYSLGVLREMIHLTRIFFNRDEEVVFCVGVFFLKHVFSVRAMAFL